MSISRAHDFTVRESTLTSIAGDQYNTTINPPGISAEALFRASAVGAAHDSAERYPPNRCAHGTREDVMAMIRRWTENGGTPAGRRPIMWIDGPAGFGKSSIAQTAAEFCAERGSLAASFFFARGNAERGGMSRLLATLAYQMTVSVPMLRRHILDALHHDPAILDRAFAAQLKKLIVDPLQRLNLPVQKTLVVVIDGLDECDKPAAVKDMLHVIATTMHSHPNLRLQFLVTSRPEVHIQTAVRSTHVSPLITIVPLVNMSAKDDILRFLTTRFAEIRNNHFDVLRDVSGPWPPQSAISRIVEDSGGLFVYAATVINFIDNPYEHPNTSLAAVLERRNTGTSPFTALHELYRQVLTAYPYTDTVRIVLGTVIFAAAPLPPPRIAALLRFPPGDVRFALRGLYSVLRIPSDDGPVQMLHDSLREFVTDAAAAGALFIDPAAHQKRLARCCLAVITADAPRVDARTLRHPLGPGALWYACEAWGRHVARAALDDELLADLEAFVAGPVYQWLEVPAVWGVQLLPTLRDASARLDEEELSMLAADPGAVLPPTPRRERIANLSARLREYEQFLVGFIVYKYPMDTVRLFYRSTPEARSGDFCRYLFQYEQAAWRNLNVLDSVWRQS